MSITSRSAGCACTDAIANLQSRLGKSGGPEKLRSPLIQTQRESSCTPFSLAAQGNSPGSLLLSPVLIDFITKVIIEIANSSQTLEISHNLLNINNLSITTRRPTNATAGHPRPHPSEHRASASTAAGHSPPPALPAVRSALSTRAAPG